MPAESTARTGWMVLLFVCVRPRSPSTRVCGMWFRFIAFVHTVLITERVRYFFYFILFSIHFSRTEKNISQNWMREPNTPKKMTSGLFYFIWLLSNWMRWVCINVCHMRVIKWAHGYSLRDVIVRVNVFVFSFIPAALSYNVNFNHSIQRKNLTFAGVSRLICRLLLRLRAFYVCMPYNLCEMWNRLWNRFYSSNGQ